MKLNYSHKASVEFAKAYTRKRSCRFEKQIEARARRRQAKLELAREKMIELMSKGRRARVDLARQDALEAISMESYQDQLDQFRDEIVDAWRVYNSTDDDPGWSAGWNKYSDCFHPHLMGRTYRDPVRRAGMVGSDEFIGKVMDAFPSATTGYYPHIGRYVAVPMDELNQLAYAL